MMEVGLVCPIFFAVEKIICHLFFFSVFKAGAVSVVGATSVTISSSICMLFTVPSIVYFLLSGFVVEDNFADGSGGAVSLDSNGVSIKNPYELTNVTVIG